VQQNSKIRDIETLQEEISSLRLEGKKISHCHGVFDLLHIGHIRHLERAKKSGGILVVTITPDKYVNKGPHRPVFGQDLRAEAIAALDCVDYVAINKWPMAVEAIQFLKPDFYVKGTEYRIAEEDRTGGITLEETAIRSVGGQLIFTDDITFSSSNLINRFLPVFPKEVNEYLECFSTRYSSKDVLRYLEDSQSLKVLVIGETIIDEYQYCEAIGKSSKEPTLVVQANSAEKFAGGSLAAANHLANFCDSVGLITFLGTENAQEAFVEDKLNSKVKRFFLNKKDSPTIVKRRFIDSYFFTKLLEVYEINDRELDKDENEQLCNVLCEQLPKYDVVVVLDFGHGMLSQEARHILCNQAPFLALNVQANAGNLGYNTLSSYERADYISVAENEIRLEARERRGDLRKMILGVSEKLKCGRISITRGKHGSLSYKAGEGFVEVPAFASQVVDRIGAGDAFLSLTALCVVQDAPMEVVCFIGNAVGAQAVATVGHRQSVDRLPLFRHIESLLK